jgi:RNA polymerase sigma factor (sigma-70 family)
VTDESEWMAGRFEEHRPHLRAVAYRMLGSLGDADDAVQESWLRLSKADTNDVENLRGWLTTVVARVCLNMLRSRVTRREELIDAQEFDRILKSEPAGAEQEAMLSDSVGLALLVVLERLTPAERLAFVLHDMFDLPFDDIAPIVGRSTDAVRQLASRARRRVRGESATIDADLRRRTEIVEAFLAASRRGDFGALVALLDPDVVLRVDDALQPSRKPFELRGALTLVQMARTFSGAALYCRLALLDGRPGIVMAPRGRLIRAFTLEFADDKISEFNVIGDPERLRQLAISIRS